MPSISCRINQLIPDRYVKDVTAKFQFASPPHKRSVSSFTMGEMEHLVAMLVGGYVQSYVDMFYLLNRPTTDKSDIKGDTDLKSVADTMVRAEKARRDGAPDQVYACYNELADYFSDTGDSIVGSFFLEKCLATCKLSGNVQGETKSNFKLGMVYQLISVTKAIAYHERHLELCTDQSDEAGKQDARKQLAVVYKRRAEELEESDETLAESVAFHDRCVVLAVENKDAEGKAMANYRLGSVYIRLQKPERAIVALTKYLDHSEKVNNVFAKAEASSKLAIAYLLIEDKISKAIEYLEQTLEIAIEIGNTDLQASACVSLGAVHTKAGDLNKARAYFDQNYNIKRNTTSHHESNISRVLVGLSLGGSRKAVFQNMVTSDMKSLLEWKVQRQFPQVH